MLVDTFSKYCTLTLHCQTWFTCLHLRLRELVDGEGGALVEVVSGVREVDEAPASLDIDCDVLPVPAGGPLQLHIGHPPTWGKHLQFGLSIDL